MKRSYIKRKPRRPKPGDDPKYLKWIREQPCVVCTRSKAEMGPREWDASGPWRGCIDPAHFGRRYTALKPPDKQALPVCRWHHRYAANSHHGLGSDDLFERAHGINIGELIAEHRARYESQK